MGRRETDLDPQAGPLERFAQDLRELRRKAGSPSYRDLAHRAHYSPSALSTAANGRVLPSLPVVEAYVEACDGDVEEWRKRWNELNQHLTEAPAPSPDYPPPARPAEDGFRRALKVHPRWVLAVTAGVAIAVAAPLTAVALHSGTNNAPKAEPTPVNSFAPGMACNTSDGKLAPLPQPGLPSRPQSGQITFAVSHDVHQWGNWWNPKNLAETVTSDVTYLGKPTLRLAVKPGFTAVGSARMTGLQPGDTVTAHLYYDGQGEATICPFIQGVDYVDRWIRVHELDLTTQSTPGWHTYQWTIPDIGMKLKGTGFQVNDTGTTQTVVYVGNVTW